MKSWFEQLSLTVEEILARRASAQRVVDSLSGEDFEVWDAKRDVALCDLAIKGLEADEAFELLKMVFVAHRPINEKQLVYLDRCIDALLMRMLYGEPSPTLPTDPGEQQPPDTGKVTQKERNRERLRRGVQKTKDENWARFDSSPSVRAEDDTDVEGLVAYVTENCMRLKHGECHTRRCLTRGGYKSGPYDASIATCEEYEIATALTDQREMISRLKEALKPFADAVYNDNGDVTISRPTTEDFMRARAALSKGEAKSRKT